MFNEQDLIEFGIASWAFQKLLDDANNDAKLTPNENLLMFNGVIFQARIAHKSNKVELFDFTTDKPIARVSTLTELLEQFKLRKC